MNAEAEMHNADGLGADRTLRGEIEHTFSLRTRKSPVDGSWAAWLESPTGATLAEGSGADEAKAINAVVLRMPTRTQAAGQLAV